MRSGLRRSSPFVCALVAIGAHNNAFAQNSLALSSGSGIPRQTTLLTLTVASAPSSEPATLIWTLNYPGGTVSNVLITDGTGQKTAYCAFGLTSTTCILNGPNAAPIPNGMIALVAVTLSATARGSIPLTVTNVQGAAPNAALMALTGTGGTITVSAVGVDALTCSPYSVGVNGTTACTLTVSQAAPDSGQIVTLTTNNGALSVPGSVLIAAGSTTVSFLVTAGSSSSDQLVTITATTGFSWVSATLIFQATALQSFGCAPTSLGSGASATCSVTVSRPVTLTGGLPVTILTSSSALQIPQSLVIPAGATAITFPITTGTMALNQTVTVTALLGGSALTTGISVMATPVINSLSCLPSSLNSSASSTCTLTLSGAAPVSGVAVAVSTNNSGISVPASITVAGGSNTAEFAVSAGMITSDQTAVVTASLSGASQSSQLSLTANAQSSGGQVLSGSYSFRHISMATDAQGNLTDARSLMGRVTFDGSGHYSYSAQLVEGSAAAVPQNGTGTYTVDSAGVVSLDSPIRSGEKVNGRYSVEAVVGSSTESAANSFDLFVAIPAPTAATSNKSLNGSYWAATLEFPSGTFAHTRDSLSLLTASGDGSVATTTVTGHAADLSPGSVLGQQLSGSIYSMSSDGSGLVVFGTGSDLLRGSKTFYVSQDGNILLGGSTAAGSHDILIGVRAGAANSSALAPGTFWAAGLRQDSATVSGFSGSAASDGSGNLHWTRRVKSLGPANTDLTQVNPYSLNPDGSASTGSTQLAAGPNGFVVSGTVDNASNPYSLYFGVPIPGNGHSGLWLNPDGIQNAANLAPPGNPIAPGELVILNISGLSVAQQTAAPPFPPSLGGVSVLINGQPAPLCLISPALIEAVVPYGTAGPTATLQVQFNGAASNTVTAAVAATAPGVFSQDGTGAGLGTVLHVDGSVVNIMQPAHSGEIVSIFLTGLGTVTPALADGAGSNPASPSSTVATPVVLVGGVPASVLFSGMAATPGLYQINVQLPSLPAGVTSLPVAISTSNAYHNQVQIAVQP
jgi:uncharacterized protein (TIGR03437 family)